MTLNADDCPCALAVASMLDVRLISDLCGEPDSESHHVVYALGRREEPAAGLSGFAVTPQFKSMGDLEGFCSKHKEAFEEAVQQDSFPEKWFWE
ncbi:hypothetical protein [Ottowia sp.]|uniref:hypothetical protein n=1 Tax=Ottowia sp. TaxID=1898956 RepID=UPI0025F44889|nr:hypothetical protein [Ottowia sp.]MBK6616643.1 hypothetical protein [Ottowia sp.]